MRNLRFFVGILFLFTALSPIVSVYNDYNSVEDNANQGTNPFGEPVLLDDLRKQIRNAVGQPCPPTQTDGGTPGDAGNATTNTAKSLGNNPTDSFTSCADTTDVEDWYEFTMDQDYNIEVTMSNYQNDYDLALAYEDNGSYYAADTSYYSDPVESVTSIGSVIDSTAGTYWVVVFPYNQGSNPSQGDYDLDIWTNYTESCIDWYNPQDDAGTGQDAPQNWSDSPTNLGNNVTSTYTGCLDSSDEGDVFAFDVPKNHTITARVTLEGSNDFDLYLHQPNGSIIDISGSFAGVDEEVTSEGSSFENQPGTYFVNVSHYSGNGNYTLEIWTNWSVPNPNIAVENITFNNQANSGDIIPIDVEVINDGTLDLSDPFMVEAVLSVDAGESWVDHNLGNITWANGLAINATQTLTINGAIPSNIVEGEYNMFIIVDREDMVFEKNENDNEITADDTLTVGTPVNACATPQDDASTGADIGDVISSAHDLGVDVETEIRGCLDSNDEADMYKITITSGQVLNVTLVSPPIDGADFDMDLLLPNGTEIDRSLSTQDDFVTLTDTDYESVAGDYYVNITYYGGIFGSNNPGGTYRLIIGEPDQSTYVPPFTCGNQNDLGLGQDASSSGIPLGTNNAISGTGCLGSSDTEDVYSFTIDDYKNAKVVFNASTGSPFSAALTDDAGNLIASGDNSSFGTMFESLGQEMYEGQTLTYTLTINSNGGEGNYNVDILVEQPAQPDLQPTSLSCPTSETFTDEEIALTWVVENLRGPGFSQSVVVLIELVDSDNVTQGTMYSSEAISENPQVYDNTAYQAFNVQDEFAFFTIPTDTPSGDYRCKIIVDSNSQLSETNESNNVMFSEPFYIQNEAELWSNDEDRDGFNSSDAGDGIVDACPNRAGTSTVDRYGCPDLDSDGVSNDNDFLPNDATQSADSDGDGYGDNPQGTNGDQCPDVAGVETGDNGVGCPILDLDGDNVLNENDECPDTPEGTIVGPDGCELIEEPEENNTNDNNVTDPTDPTDSTDPTDPTDPTDDNSGETTDASDETESESEIFGMSTTTFGIAIAIIVVLLLTVFFVMGRNSGKDDFDMQQKAYADASYAAVAAVSGFGGADASITPEQLAYEQQLMAAGYPADYARAYADQHFRPWLKQ